MIYSVGVFIGGLIVLGYLAFNNADVLSDVSGLEKIILSVLGLIFLISLKTLIEIIVKNKQIETERKRRAFINKMTAFNERENNKW